MQISVLFSEACNYDIRTFSNIDTPLSVLFTKHRCTAGKQRTWSSLPRVLLFCSAPHSVCSLRSALNVDNSSLSTLQKIMNIAIPLEANIE
ncbi:unnamed protein product [Ixodes pacificus]